MKLTRKLVSTALGLGLAVASLAAVPASVTGGAQAPGATVTAAYTGEDRSQQAENRAFFKMIQKKVQKKQAAEPGFQAVTITYNDSAAPSFQGEISQSTQIWNQAVSAVTLREVSSWGADFTYREGNSARGSHARTDGRGHGYVFIDYRQARQYYPLRIVSHETGHILGLPDHYSGPCSELMSGGGAGPSCRNPYPNQYEAARVDRNFGGGWLSSSAQKPELATTN